MHEKFFLTGKKPNYPSIELSLNELRKDLPTDTDLPVELEKVVKGPEDSRRMFDTALQYWQQAYDRDEIIRAIAAIEENGDDFPAAMQLLKRVRRPGNILISAFLMFDGGHFAPEKHWKVVMNIGKVRDYARTVLIGKYIGRIRSAIAEYSFDEMAGAFNPDPQLGFEQYISKVISNMKNIVLTAPPDDVESLHILRKNGTRVLMNLFQLSCLSDLRSDHYQMFAYLKMIDKQLGDAHDAAEDRRIKQAGSYDGVRMVVSERVKNQILETIDFLAREWQLDLDRSTGTKQHIFSEDQNRYI